MLSNKNYFKIIQITDTHLFKEDTNLFGLNSNRNFSLVIDQIMLSDISDADAVFLIGDLSQDETHTSYENLAKVVSSLNKPIYWIPGNHDSEEVMNLVFSSYENFNRVRRLETPYWDFIFINSKINNNDKGCISAEELMTLEYELNNNQSKNIALVMHHHPVEVGTPIVDEYILINRAELWDKLSKYNVNLIICGHVHGDYTVTYRNTTIETSPATCLQWEKGATKIKIEEKIGYKTYFFREKSYDFKTKIWCI